MFDTQPLIRCVSTTCREAGDICWTGEMAVGRAARREQRRPRVAEQFGGDDLERALDLLELLEIAWHDTYGEITPPEHVVDDVLLLAEGDLGYLISAAHTALADWRDTRVAADDRRRSS